MALTKYKEGSIRELLVLALPLMLSSFSVMTMVFADRWLLAHYSISAHNAAVVASTLGWGFLFGWVVLSNVAQVFAAQYHGAGKFQQLGEPVWQMIWMAIGSIAFFLPLSFYGGELFFGSGSEHAYERAYFGWMIMFGPFHALYGALSGFFIAQGKTRLVSAVVLLANVMNILLDNLLIFGVEGWIPALDVTGAAIATNVATLLQALILGAVFLNKKNRTHYGSAHWRLQSGLLWECIRIGFPGALFVIIEIFAYALYYGLMQGMGEKYITIIGICQNMFILLFFFFEGMSKAASTIIGNMLGAGEIHQIKKVVRSGVTACTFFLCFLLGLFTFGSDLITRQFLPDADPVFMNQIRSSLELCLILTALFLFFDGIKFFFMGVLTAAGDTLFLLISSSLIIWGAMILPVKLLVVQNQGPVELACTICMFCSLLTCSIYFWRITKRRWRPITLDRS